MTTKVQNGEYLETWEGEVLVSSVLNLPPPAPVKSWPAFDFYRKFTAAERVAARALAVTDPIAFDFLHTLDLAVADKRMVQADDADTVAGMAYLSAVPSGAPVLAAGRADTILS